MPPDSTARNSSDDFSITRVFDAPRELVFRAYSEAAHLKNWWGPKGFEVFACSVDARPGGVFHYGLKSSDGTAMWGKRVFHEVVSPERLVYVFSFSDEAGATTRHAMASGWPIEMISTASFTEEGPGKTRITLTASPHDASREEEAAFAGGHDSMRQGFAGTFDQLQAYLAEQCAPQPVTPYLTVDGAADAIAYYAKAFGAVERMRLPADDGRRLMHACIGINGGSVFLSDSFPEYGESSVPRTGEVPPVAIALNLDSPADVDTTFHRAVAAGGTAVTEPRDEFWGARFAVLSDPFGHRWLLNAALSK